MSSLNVFFIIFFAIFLLFFDNSEIAPIRYHVLLLKTF